MSQQLLGILIGGIAPMFAFGLSNVFLKAGEEQGISISMFLICSVPGALLAGVCMYLLQGKTSITLNGAFFAFLWGLFGCLGAGLVIYALERYNSPLSILAPLYNTNTLVAVLLALWVFAEWRQVKIPQLLIGSVLIIIG